MTLTKNQKILLGIAHFLPLIGFLAYIIGLFLFVFGAMEAQEANPGAAPGPDFFFGMIWAMVSLLLAVLVSIAVKIIDIIHLVKNNEGEKGNKVLLWVLLIVFAGTIAEIIYFFIEILPEKKQETQNLTQKETRI